MFFASHFFFDSIMEMVQFLGLVADHSLWSHSWLGMSLFVKNASMKVELCLLRIYMVACFFPV